MKGAYREVEVGHEECEEVYNEPCGFKTGDECKNCELIYESETDDTVDDLDSKGFDVWDIYENETVGNMRTFALLVSKRGGGLVPRKLSLDDEDDSGLDLPKAPPNWIEMQFAKSAKEKLSL